MIYILWGEVQINFERHSHKSADLSDKELKFQIGQFLDDLDSHSQLKGYSWSVEQIMDQLELNSFQLLRVNDRIVSMILFRQLGHSCAEVLFLATSQRFSGNGYMKRFLRSFVSCSGFKEVWLECRSHPSHILNFYLKLGFRVVGFRKAYYADGCDSHLLTFGEGAVDKPLIENQVSSSKPDLV